GCRSPAPGTAASPQPRPGRSPGAVGSPLAIHPAALAVAAGAPGVAPRPAFQLPPSSLPASSRRLVSLTGPISLPATMADNACSITVAGSGRRVDVSLPGSLPVAELLSELVEI